MAVRRAKQVGGGRAGRVFPNVQNKVFPMFSVFSKKVLKKGVGKGRGRLPPPFSYSYGLRPI